MEGLKVVGAEWIENDKWHLWSIAAGRRQSFRYKIDLYWHWLHEQCVTGMPTLYSFDEETVPKNKCGPLTVLTDPMIATSLSNSLHGLPFRCTFTPTNECLLYSPRGYDTRNNWEAYPSTQYASGVQLIRPKKCPMTNYIYCCGSDCAFSIFRSGGATVKMFHCIHCGKFEIFSNDFGEES